MVLVEVCPVENEGELNRDKTKNAPVVVLTTSETATSGMLAVLSDTTVTGGDVAAVLARFGEVGRHLSKSRSVVRHPHSYRPSSPSCPFSALKTAYSQHTDNWAALDGSSWRQGSP
jgi:hypothetical protein